jgi:hypothetical protein
MRIEGVFRGGIAMRSQLTAIAAFAATIGFGLTAFAQQAGVGVQGSGSANTQAGVTAQADSNATAQAPAAAPAPAQNQQVGMGLGTGTAAPAPGGSDHDAVVGHLAVGFLGRASIPYGLATNPELPVPVIGVRYWLDPMLGLDLGAGLYLGGTSTDVKTTPPGNTVSASGPKPAAFVIHAGVPLALASARHFTFEIIPEANFGYASVTGDAASNAAGITKQTGMHLDLGARAGGEIHFGFMGIPQLSLVGSVGLRFDYDKLGQDAAAAAGATRNQSTSVWALRTSVYDSPWNIFISNVSAFYYF